MSKVMVSLILVAFLAGCAGSPIQTGWESEKNRKALVHLKIGMTKRLKFKTLWVSQEKQRRIQKMAEI